MTGTFIRKKFSGILSLICGLFLIGLFLFVNFVDNEEPNYAYVGIILGAVITLFGVLLLTFNYKAHFSIEDDRILSKYHWFGRLDCSLADVAFVSFSARADVKTYALTILLKSGKRHIITGIENSQMLCSAIRRQIFSVEAESPNKLRQELESTQAANKKALYGMLGGIALMVVNIFIVAFLTDGKEMHEFSVLDWMLFAIMGIIEGLTVVVMFYSACKCGQYALPIDVLQHRLRGAIIATQPLPAGNVREVYEDENHLGRIIIFGFPNDEDIYYCVQEFTGNYNLETVHTSEVFASDDERFAEMLLPFMNITPQFKQNAQ